MFVMMIIYKFEVIMLLSSFQGLKAGAQSPQTNPQNRICADCFGPSKSQFLGPQTDFEGCKFEGCVRHALNWVNVVGV
jgi:hypothetical protein